MNLLRCSRSRWLLRKIEDMSDKLAESIEDDNSVTMLDVLQVENQLEEDAYAVLGASDDQNCTYNKVGTFLNFHFLRYHNFIFVNCHFTIVQLLINIDYFIFKQIITGIHKASIVRV